MTLTDPTTPGGSSSPGAFTDAVLIDDTAGGAAWIPASTPLTRLNYYDGRFLRADDLNVEQRAQRAHVELSNRAGGPGVVNGFVVRHQAGALVLSPGLAIDPQGRVLFLPGEVQITAAKLVEAASRTGTGAPGALAEGGGGFGPCEVATATPNVPTVGGMQLYLVALAHAEGLCGTAEVFGRLCDDACVTATDRPYRLDGVVLLVRPMSLVTPLPTSTAVTLGSEHLRSRVAAAAFSDERSAAGGRLSAAALASNVWCVGAPALTGDAVPLAVLAWDGSVVGFLDVWSARRERMEAPPRAYWAGRTELRPWPVFLAQVLQFQCQLADLLTGGSAPSLTATGACGDAVKLLGESTRLLEGLAEEVTKLGQIPEDTPDPAARQSAGMPQVQEFRAKVAQLLSGREWLKAPGGPEGRAPAHLLVDGGIVEVPAGGYLPVDPGSTTSVRGQVQDLLGAGVDLRLCAVRRDQVPHELERAQHMDRISLLRGLDDATAKEKVDVLVPDGLTASVPAADTGRSFGVEGAIGYRTRDLGGEGTFPQVTDATMEEFRDEAVRDPRLLPMQGAGRFEVDATGVNVRVAGVGNAGDAVRPLLRLFGAPAGPGLDSLVARAKRLKVNASLVTREELDRVGRAVAEEVLRHRAKGAGTSPLTRIISLRSGVVTRGLVALWATAWTAKDPFTLPTGASTGISFTLDFYAPGLQSSLVSRRFDGRAEVLSSVVSGALRHVTLRLAVADQGEVVNLRDAADTRRSRQGDVVITQGVVDGQQVLGFRTPGTEAFITGVGTSSGDPMVFQAAVGRVQRGDLDLGVAVTTGGSKLTLGTIPVPGERLLKVKAVEDPAVTDPGNPYHEFAEQALTALQGAKPDDPAFFDTASAQLFPARGAGESTEVRATTDWVLFRRRRREECEGAGAPAPTPSAVAAFVARAEDREAAEDIARRLRDPDGSVEDVSWKAFGTAEFDRGSAVLRTAGGVLREGYRDAEGGALVAFAGYASPGASDPVGRPRARAVVAALAPVATLVDPDQVDLVVTPPPGQVPPGAEAGVFLVSHEGHGSGDCVDVMVLPNFFTDEGKALRAALGQRDLAAFNQFEHVLVRMGDVSWTEERVDEEQLQVMLDAYEKHRREQDEAGTPVHANDLFAWIAEDWAREHDAEAREHLKFLADKLGVPLEVVEVVDFPHEDRCPVLLVVMFRPEQR